MSDGSREGLMTPDQAAELISTGRTLSIAGDRDLLLKLPKGNWIGGTTPYFVASQGGLCSRDDSRWPLVADYCGALVNVSIQAVDTQARGVRFYAPVFEGVRYRFAKPVVNYPEAFLAAMPGNPGEVLFSCNCVLNYLYSNLEGQRTAQLMGPITFGEVAYQLLNQTAVYLTLERD